VFGVPASPPDSGPTPGAAGLLILAGVGETTAPGTPGGFAPGTFTALGSCFGTLGRRCAKISAARMGPGPAGTDGISSAVLVITIASSSRCRSAAGFTLMARKGSLSRSGVELVTVPTGRPLG